MIEYILQIKKEKFNHAGKFIHKAGKREENRVYNLTTCFCKRLMSVSASYENEEERMKLYDGQTVSPDQPESSPTIAWSRLQP